MRNLHQTLPHDNPLLAVDTPMRFADIEPQHIEPAVRMTLEALRAEVTRLAAVSEPDVAWLQDMERIHERLQRVWSPVSHLNAVASSPALRDAFNHCLPAVTAFTNELEQNTALFGLFERLEKTLQDGQGVEAELVAQSLRDFRLAGVELPAGKKERYSEVVQTLAAREATFEQNIMEAADSFEYHETAAGALEGLPGWALERARDAAEKRSMDGWLLTLDMPTYSAVVTHARSSRLRERFYRAWVTRASDLGPAAGRWDNGPVMVDILALRHEAARLLGFENYAELSLATKMADSAATVLDFLRDLAERSRQAAKDDLAELAAIAGRPIDAWDVAYFSEQLRQQRFKLDQEALRAYFPLPKVLAGLFGLVERLFGLRIREASPVAPWHSTVARYEIERHDGGAVGGLLVDLFARPHKRSGAWMDSCRDRARLPGLDHDPIAHLVCNFNPPTADGPSMLTHGEVVTLFHEFGHCLHHLLTQVSYPSLAGINGVAWDAVELPSQFLENFAWLPEVLRTLSAHDETGDPLPEDTIATLVRSRTFQAGLAMQRQIEFALFDFQVHSLSEPPSVEEAYRVLDEVRQEITVVDAPSYNRFPHSFAHVFGGGYAAGYYSYKWAEVLAADAFAAFGDDAPLDPNIAAGFERSILAVGGSRPALDAFVAFRGRAPELEPLLKQSGIACR